MSNSVSLFNSQFDKSSAQSIARSLDRSIDRSTARSITRLLDRSVVRSLDRAIARSLDHSIARSLGRSLDCSECGHLCPLVGEVMNGELGQTFRHSSIRFGFDASHERESRT